MDIDLKVDCKPKWWKIFEKIARTGVQHRCLCTGHEADIVVIMKLCFCILLWRTKIKFNSIMPVQSKLMYQFNNNGLLCGSTQHRNSKCLMLTHAVGVSDQLSVLILKKGKNAVPRGEPTELTLLLPSPGLKGGHRSLLNAGSKQVTLLVRLPLSLTSS